ncbi:Isoleucine--tRNA ligase [Grifola frondosa]|uniref:isoleucine--tRNA ligase n=1 Tax=Grifola frondosa TaxID=5627 RepID=A0A1C7MLK0_GRIFR|nr:Isoleucine--tRNA ligase [Grifola frondosa]
MLHDPSKDETIRRKTTEELYRWQWKNATGPLFVLHDGPRTANGDLHMGHALNKILKAITRYHVLLGHRVQYVVFFRSVLMFVQSHSIQLRARMGLPRTAYRNKVLKNLGKDVHDLSPNVIRAEAEAFAKSEVQSQLEQFREYGIMADWSQESTYRTLDPDYEIRQLRIFQKMVQNGLIYRNYRPVHYSPSSQTALAEAELTYEDHHISHSVYVDFRLDLDSPGMSPVLRTLVGGHKGVNLLVWTTTPWTLTANMAIAVNPEMVYKIVAASSDASAQLTVYASERQEALAKLPELLSSSVLIGEISGSELVGASYRPIFSSLFSAADVPASLPIIASSHVTPDSGTGLVHTAPAHGAEDYAVMRSLGLLSTSVTAQNLVCHVNELGLFTDDVAEVVGHKAAGALVGKEVLGDGGKAIVNLLKEIEALRKVQRIKHRYPYDWKTDKPVIVLATSQWFTNLDNIKDNAIAALQDVAFYPAASRNRLEAFIRNRSEWCISRQRVWGVPIPALYHIPSGRAVLNSDSLTHIMAVLEEKGTSYWWDGPVEEFVPPSLRDGMDIATVAENWRKGTDTMDVWFDSGTSWSMLDNLYKGNREAGTARHFGADVCLEGSDQHRGWFQSQLLTAIGSATSDERKRTSPYGALITHGMVLDEKGMKMSKSLGNILSPKLVINGGEVCTGFSADVLRLWAATVDISNDVSIGPKILKQREESLRKIRNVARFILGNLRDRSVMDKARWIERTSAERFMMHELYKLEDTARKGYDTYNFPQVINALLYFASVRLSSLYLDFNKDCLYANAVDSLQRRRTLTILHTMTRIMAPILPYLAEDIHATLTSDHDKANVPSVFTRTWTPLSSDWIDPGAERDMTALLLLRSKVLGMLEQARQDKKLKSSLEAEVILILPESDQRANSTFIDLLQREEDFLETLFIVSDAYITDEGSLGASSAEWLYTETYQPSAGAQEIGIQITSATQTKCPRCWTFTCYQEDKLCHRHLNCDLAATPHPSLANVSLLTDDAPADSIDSTPFDDDAQAISVPDAADAGESGKLKMIVQLVKKCLGVKDIAAMYDAVLQVVSLLISLQASLSAGFIARAHTQSRVLALSGQTRLVRCVRRISYLRYDSLNNTPHSINDSDDPFERMLAVIRFTFSKDLKFIRGKVCKPYNSVLGEHFRSHWDVIPVSYPSDPSQPPIQHLYLAPAAAESTYSSISLTPTDSLRPYSSETASIRSGKSGKSSKSAFSGLSFMSRGYSTTAKTTPATSPELAEPLNLETDMSNLNLSDDDASTPADLLETDEPPAGADKPRLRIVYLTEQISAKVSGTTLRVMPGSFNKGVFINITGDAGAGERYQITHPVASVNGLLRGSFYVTVGDATIITCNGSPDGQKLRAIIEYKEESWLGKAHFLCEGVIHSYEPEESQHHEWTRVKHVPRSRVLATFDGSWKHHIRWKRIDAPESEYATLIDLSTLHIVPKSVRPLEKQLPNESRKLWENVTNGLVSKEYSEATKHKLAIEQRQRDEAAERKRKGVQFTPRYFERDIDSGIPTLTPEGRKALEEELAEETIYPLESSTSGKAVQAQP